jgi:hypothetical protein
MIKDAKLKFQAQRYRAGQRNIPWDLTFEQWFEIWQASGHFEERGNKSDQYCMSRIGDKGSYAIGNVFIQTNAENIKQMWNNETRFLHIESIRQSALKRAPCSAEKAEKHRQANLGRILGPVYKITCPHCNKEGGANIMKRWHMDNCKSKEYI